MEFPTFLFRFAVLGVRSTLGGFSLHTHGFLSASVRFAQTIATLTRIKSGATIRAGAVVTHSLLTSRAIWGSILKSRTTQCPSSLGCWAGTYQAQRSYMHPTNPFVIDSSGQYLTSLSIFIFLSIRSVTDPQSGPVNNFLRTARDFKLYHLVKLKPAPTLKRR